MSAVFLPQSPGLQTSSGRSTPTPAPSAFVRNDGFRRLLQERATKGKISQAMVKKIAYDNGKTFFGV